MLAWALQVWPFSVWSRLGQAGTLRNAGTPRGQEWGIRQSFTLPRKDTDFIVPLLEQVSELCMFFILQWLLTCLVCGFGGDCVLHAVLVIQQLLQVGVRAYWACLHPKFLCCYAGPGTHWSCMSALTLPFQAVTVLVGYVFFLLPAFPISLSLSFSLFQTPLNSIPSRLLPIVVNLFKIEAFPPRVRREALWLRKQSKKQTKLSRHRKLLKLTSLRRTFPQG